MGDRRTWLHYGYLEKRQKHSKGLVSRFYVFKSNLTLEEYKIQEKLSFQKSIEGITEIDMVNDEAKLKFGFKLKHSGGVTEYYCPSYAERAIWGTVIRESIISVTKEIKDKQFYFMEEKLGMRFQAKDQLIFVSSVAKGYPSASAGVRIGDQLIKINSTEIQPTSDVNSIAQILVSTRRPITITIRRENISTYCFDDKPLGLKVHVNDGIVVVIFVEKDGQADKLGVEIGDVIVSINNEACDASSTSAFNSIVKQIRWPIFGVKKRWGIDLVSHEIPSNGTENGEMASTTTTSSSNFHNEKEENEKEKIKETKEIIQIEKNRSKVNPELENPKKSTKELEDEDNDDLKKRSNNEKDQDSSNSESGIGSTTGSGTGLVSGSTTTVAVAVVSAIPLSNNENINNNTTVLADQTNENQGPEIELNLDEKVSRIIIIPLQPQIIEDGIHSTYCVFSFSIKYPQHPEDTLIKYRYSDFDQLRTNLMNSSPFVGDIPFPPKTIFRSSGLNTEVIATRSLMLGVWLDTVLNCQELDGSRLLQEFISLKSFGHENQ